MSFAQRGLKAPYAKPMKGFGGASVLEVVDDFDGDTYRAVYTVRFAGVVYVLHAFQKKSKRGTATPKPDLVLIEQRLKRAQEDYEQWVRSKNPKSR
jgi:phage-related protein